MFSILPTDIIDTIITNLNYHPVELLELRNVNKIFREKIDQVTNSPNYKFNDHTNKKLDELLMKKVTLKSIEWLFSNNVEFKLNHVRTMIINNRIDIIKKGFFYSDFLKLIFNRFYLSEEDLSENVLYAAYESNNPIIVAAKYNRVEIVRLLIEQSTVGNPYSKVINGILNIAVRYNHKNLFCYLVTYQYESIKILLKGSQSKIIHRIDNCEDIFFYMILNKKIDIDINILLGCITKNYKDLFFYCYKILEIKDRLKLITKAIEVENIELFNYIMSDYNVSDNFFTETLFKKRKFSKDFLQNIINRYLMKVTLDSDLIEICIDNDIDDNTIIKLIHINYRYTDHEMALVLSDRRINLLRVMCEKYKE